MSGRIGVFFVFMALLCNAGWCVPAEAGEAVDMIEIDVREFGAVPDDGQDDTLGVQAALDHAKTLPASRVIFPKGVYDFHAGANDQAPHIAIAMNGMHDITVVGREAELLLHGHLTCFGVGSSRNIVIEGFTIDCATMPFSQGDVVAVEDHYVDVRVHDHYPVTDGMPVHAVNDYDRATRCRVPRGADIYWSVDRTELIAPQTLRLHAKWRFNLEVGALVLLRHQVYGFNAFVVHQCEEVLLRDHTIYCVPGMGVTGDSTTNMTVERVRIVKRPGTDRLVSATADGSHFGGCRGKVILRDCLFEDQGDDAVNAKHGLYLTVIEPVDATTVRARHNLEMHHPPTVGEQLELTHPDTLLAFGTPRVAGFETEADGFTYVVRFEEPLPAEVVAGTLLGCYTNNAEFLIQRNVFRNNRARGLLIQVRGAVIEDNLFEGCTNGGIYLVSDTVHFYECSPARDVVIRNNRFVNCNNQGSNEGVIGVFGWRKDWTELPVPGVFKNIVIEHNEIDGTDGAGLFINGAEGVRIAQNTIRNTSRHPGQDRSRAAIHVSASREVVIEQNTALPEEQTEGCANMLTITDTCEKDSIRIENNQGF